jgi:hypothetical protein
MIEIIFSTDEAQIVVTQQIAVSTRSGLTSLPDLGDAGVVCKAEKQFMFATSGLSFEYSPQRLGYLPPIPIAAPSLYVYAQTSVDNSFLRGDTIETRFCFTTGPLDSKAYTEIAETWGW